MAARRADRALFLRIHGRPTPLLDQVLPPLSRAADHGLLWLGVAAALAATGDKRNRRAALRGLASLALASAAANGPLKRAFRRTRPDLDPVAMVRRLRRQPLTTSFPSGHSASAAAFATGVALERPWLGAAVAVPALGVGASRVHTGVHYPTDVAAGLALGGLAAWALTRVWPPQRPLAPEERAPAIALPRLADGAGLVVVVNPGSGGADETDALRAALTEQMPAAQVRAVGEEEDFVEVLREVAASVKVLGIAGGDGSLNAGAQAALDADVPLLVIPTGTLNHFAGDLGVGSLGEALDALRAGSGALVDVAAVRSGTGNGDLGQGAIFLNNASIGAYPEMVAAREQLEQRLGKWPAMVVALVKILHGSDPIEVSIDGTPRQVWLLFVGNCRYSPPGFAPSWRNHLDDGVLDVRVLDATHPYARSRLVAAILLGRLGRSAVFETRTAQRVQVRVGADGVRAARDGEVGQAAAEFEFVKAGRLSVYRP